MALVNISDLKIGQTIKFKSVSDHDTVLWEGTIIGSITYDAAILMEDILPYYREAKKSNMDLAPIEELNFFILKLAENTTKITTRIFAFEYIDTSTLKINDVYSNLYFKVYGTPETETNTILTLLRSHGYTVQSMTNVS